MAQPVDGHVALKLWQTVKVNVRFTLEQSAKAKTVVRGTALVFL
jgi:hypothetical protein